MKGLLISVVALGAFAAALSPASATPDGDNITVTGKAPAVCVLGTWDLTSGSASFTGGQNAVATYDSSVMTDANGDAALGPSNALTFHAPLVCNTPINWSFSTTKGSFALDNPPSPVPGGFSDAWTYGLSTGPFTSGGAPVEFTDTLTSNGLPAFGGFNLNAADSESISYMQLVFTPVSQTAKMLAGHYSEMVTLTVSPSL